MKKIINSVEDLKELARRIKGATDPITVDTETNGLFPIEDFIVGWSLAFSEVEGYYIPRKHRQSLNVPDHLIAQLFELLQQKMLVWHNAKFDIEMILTNFALEMPIYSDTIVMAYLSPTFKRLALKEIMSEHFHYETKEFDELLTEKFGKQWRSLGYTAADLTAEDIADYAVNDVLYTYKLYNMLKDEMNNYRSIFKLELNLIPIVAKMNLSGITINSDKLRELSAEAKKELQERFDLMQVAFNEKTRLAREFSASNDGLPYPEGSSLYNEAGMKPLTELYNVEFKPGSTYHIRAMLIEGFNLPVLKRTDKSAISTDAEVLEEYATTYHCDFAKQLLEYRSLAKYITNYLDKIPEICSHTGKLYASFNAVGADSGRFTCPGSQNWQDEDRTVNLQNQPRDDNKYNIRTCYIAPEGYTWVKCDYKQQEYRAMCNIAGEQGAIQKFRDGVDFHEATARFMFSIPDDQPCPKDLRSVAKCVTGDTLIYSPSHGLIRIEDVSNLKVVDTFTPLDDFKVINMAGETVEADSFYYGGVRKVINIETKYGFKLAGSTDKHKIVVLDDHGMPVFKKVADITTDDYVLLYIGGFENKVNDYVDIYSQGQYYDDLYDHRMQLNRRRRKACPEIHQVTESIGEFIGMTLARGSFVTTGTGTSIQLSTTNKDLADYYVNLFHFIWPDFNISLHAYSKARKKASSAKEQYLCTFTSHWVGSLLTEGGLRCKRKEIPFPKFILSSPESVQTAFLKGLFMTRERTLNQLNAISTCQYESINISFLKNLQQLLLSFGILASITSDNTTDSHCLHVLSVSIQRFVDLIFGSGVLTSTLKDNCDAVAYNLNWLCQSALQDKFDADLKLFVYRNTVNSFSYRFLNYLYENVDMADDVRNFIKMYIDRKIIALPVRNVYETEEKVYDLHVPDGHQFIGNGFINHNTINFGLNYGMGLNTLAKKINRTPEETKQLYDKYFQNLPRVQELSKWAREQVEQTELIKTYFGRVRKLEWRGKDNYAADMIKNSGFNTMIQGTCADITKIAMLRVQDRVLDKYPEDVVQMKLQVHDELDFIVRNDMLDEVCAAIKNAMTIPTPDDWVDFEIDVEIGPSWSEMDHTDWEGDWQLDKFTGWGDIVPKKYQSYLTVPGYSATWGGYGKGGN